MLTLVAGPGERAVACSCAPLSDMEAFDFADTVFVGTLIETRSKDGPIFGSDDPERFVFQVDNVYKGEAFERQSVVTARDGASCGLEVSGSGPIVVFARSSAPDDATSPGELESGEVRSSLCSGTRLVGLNPLPALFGEGLPPIAGSSAIGGSSTFNWTPVLLTVGGMGAVALAAVVVRRRQMSSLAGAGTPN